MALKAGVIAVCHVALVILAICAATDNFYKVSGWFGINISIAIVLNIKAATNIYGFKPPRKGKTANSRPLPTADTNETLPNSGTGSGSGKQDSGQLSARQDASGHV